MTAPSKALAKHNEKPACCTVQFQFHRTQRGRQCTSTGLHIQELDQYNQHIEGTYFPLSL